MMTVLLVDDEINITEGLAASVEWERFGFRVVGTARDGEEGCAMAAQFRPDLIITDISMPRMDGIEMAAAIRQQAPGTRMVFLTCHKEFEYARSAVRLGVDEYLIKDTMSREDIDAVLARIQSGAREAEEKKKLDREIAAEMHRNRSQLSRNLFQDILATEEGQEESLHSRLHLYGYHLDKQKITVAALSLDGYAALVAGGLFDGDRGLIDFAVLNVAGEILHRHDMGEVFPAGVNEYAILFCYNANLKLRMSEELEKISREIQSGISLALGVHSSVRIGQSAREVCHIRRVYEELKNHGNSRFYAGDGGVYFCGDAGGRGGELPVPERNALLRAFDEQLEALDEEALFRTVRTFCEKAEASRIQAVQVIQIADSFAASLEKKLMLCESTGLMQDWQEFRSGLALADSITHVFRAFDALAEVTLEELRRQAAYTCSPEMRRIIRYITGHLEEDISLERVAAFVNMNTSYFSRYFKSKAGMNFVDYLTDLRIEKAKSLLSETDLSLEDISVRVGHVNKAYFTKVFKKITGITPGEFRKSRYSQKH